MSCPLGGFLSCTVLRFLLAGLMVATAAPAQLTIFFADSRGLGRLDSPPLVGDLDVDRWAPGGSAGTLARGPNQALFAVEDSIQRLDPESLLTTPVKRLEQSCQHAAADGDGHLWCAGTGRLFQLEANSYRPLRQAAHASFDFRAIARRGARLFAVARLPGDPSVGHQFLEIKTASGDVSVLRPLRLPPSPVPGRSLLVTGMDFDDHGDLWLGLALEHPDRPTASSDGYLLRILDPLGGAIPQAPQRLRGTHSPSPLVLGAPAAVEVPAVGPAGLAVLVGTLMLSALAMLTRRPIEDSY